MKEKTRTRLSELILEELSDKIKHRDSLKQKLEAFTDLPVEKVAEAILKQFEYLLSSELRDLIIHLIQQDIAAEQASKEFEAQPAASAARVPVKEVPATEEKKAKKPAAVAEESNVEESAEIAEPVATSIMEHFGTKEVFSSKPIDIEFKENDWFYILGFGYSPDSAGKGVPSRKLNSKGVDRSNEIFLLDYGDIRFYMHRLTLSDYTLDKAKRPTMTSQKTRQYKRDHEKILNTFRGEEVLVTVPFWTIVQGLPKFLSIIENRYVELLRALVDIHDAIEWDVEVFAFDEHIINLPSITEAPAGRTVHREPKHVSKAGRDVKLIERVIIREKGLVQDIHNQLLLHASRAKIDHMIRLDNAFLDDWKSILAARYTVGKDKRKNFCKTILSLQKQLEEYDLMFRVTSPANRFALV